MRFLSSAHYLCISHCMHTTPFNNIEILNGLRGFAILCVFIQHQDIYPFFGQIDIGGVGVDIFFVLSSFLLTVILYKKMLGYVHEGRNVKDWFLMLSSYLVRRILRVYPLFLVNAVFLWCLQGKYRIFLEY